MDGEIIKHFSNRYAKIKIKIKVGENNSVFHWEVSENQISIEYLDGVLSTIKSLFNLNENFIDFRKLSFHIIDGQSHPVDSNMLAFEMATVKAIIDAITDEGD